MSISIEDFNANFIVQISSISKPHIDETDVIPAVVGFNITCSLNNRVQYFEYHFTDQNIVDTFTSQQLVDYAWTQLKTAINTWASIALMETNLIGYIYIPGNDFNITFSNMNLAIFNDNYTVSINRFEVYPKNNPYGWCVGFNIINKVNKVNIFVDTNVIIDTFSVTKTETIIMNTAWDQLKDSIGTWASDKISYSSLINTDYVPVSF